VFVNEINGITEKILIFEYMPDYEIDKRISTTLVMYQTKTFFLFDYAYTTSVIKKFFVTFFQKSIKGDIL